MTMKVKTHRKIKKPSFILTYWECLIVVAAFLALIGVLVYGNYAGEYGERASRMMATEESRMSGIIAITLNKEKVTPQDVVRLKQELVWHYSTTGQRFEVYYNKEKITDTSRAMIMHYSPEYDAGEEPQLYFFELADEKYLKYFDTPEVLQYKTVIPVIDLSEGVHINPKFDEQPVIEIGVREAYVNFETGKFIPVSCYVLDPKAEHSLQLSGVLVSIPIEKGSPELKGYTYIKSNGIDNFSASIEGYEGPEEEPYNTAVSMNDYGIYYGYKSSKITVESFDDAYKTQIMIGNCVLVIAMLALTLIPAALIFNRKKRDYEIFEYRRKVTDAMAHDLKTPMAAILTYAENLENHTGENKQEFYVSKISEKVWQMNKMVNSMLDFSRGENDSVTVNKTAVDIGAVLADAIAENEHEITKRSLKVDYDKKEVTVNTDKVLFSQAVGNLINNAALYAKEGSTVSITCDSSKVCVINVVAEKVEDAEAMKQPFAKGNESRRNMGSGLGLAIAENNLVLLGYKLEVKSEGDNFVVTITL